jgi:hypothetical protein
VWSSCKNILFHLSGVPRLRHCELYHLTLVRVICIKYILIYHLILFELKRYACYDPSCCIFDVSALLFDWVSARSCAFINNSITGSWRLSKHFDCMKSFCRLKTPKDVQLGLIMMMSSWQRRKTWHGGFDSFTYGKFSLLWVM